MSPCSEVIIVQLPSMTGDCQQQIHNSKNALQKAIADLCIFSFLFISFYAPFRLPIFSASLYACLVIFCRASRRRVWAHLTYALLLCVAAVVSLSGTIDGWTWIEIRQSFLHMSALAYALVSAYFIYVIANKRAVGDKK